MLSGCKAVPSDSREGLADSVLQVLLSLIVAAMFWVNGDVVGQVMRELMGRLAAAPR